MSALTDYIKEADAGKEKHLPAISAKECSSCGELNVTIQVGGEVLHPSTAEHSIKTITVYGSNNEGQLKQLTVFQLGDENTVARVRTSVKKGNFTKIVVASYCNLHGLWENSIDI